MNPYSDVASNMLLKDRVYNTLKNEIILGHLKPGETLNIYELSAMMNISGAPVREALNMLGKDGFVSLSPRKQATVASASFHDWEVVTNMRLLLEPYAARISTPNIPQKDIDDLRDQLEKVSNVLAEDQVYLELDRAVHHLLHAYAGSLILSETLTTLKEHSARVHYYPTEASEQKNRETFFTATKEHLAILDAIESRNPDAAALAVKLHLTQYIRSVDPSWQ